MAREPLKNVGASVRARLLQRSRDQRTDFQILLTRYALERLLYRLSRSDYYDLWLIADTFELDRAPLAAAVRQTFARRDTALPQEKPTGLSEAYVDTWGDQWRTFLNRKRMATAPEQLATVVADLERFVLPLIEEAEGDWRWKPGTGWIQRTARASMDVLCSLKERTRLIRLAAICALLAGAGPCLAWGDLGHQVTALIAYRHLTVAARAHLDALLAGDSDSLTAPDFASRASWADRYRNSHRETSAWHYVNMEIDHPDLAAACYDFPALHGGEAASAGPAQDCIVNKITEFEAELRDPATGSAERLTALKFLIHFIGDLHQPLHASDHEDRGGNCIGLAPSPDGHDTNLHAYWDVGAVEALGSSAAVIAAQLDARITPGELRAWSQGDAKGWAMESFELGRKDVYSLATGPGCEGHDTVALTTEYETAASKDAALQLEKAGVRMATVLNRALVP